MNVTGKFFSSIESTRWGGHNKRHVSTNTNETSLDKYLRYISLRVGLCEKKDTREENDE